jgi:hypothetical protein
MNKISPQKINNDISNVPWPSYIYHMHGVRCGVYYCDFSLVHSGGRPACLPVVVVERMRVEIFFLKKVQQLIICFSGGQ